MGITPESITSNLNLGALNIFGDVGSWVGNIIIAALLAGGVYLIYQYFFTYTIPVKWYWVRGAIRKGDQKDDMIENKKDVPFGIVSGVLSSNYDLNEISPSKEIKDKGRLVTKKGVTYIQLLKGRAMFKYFPKHRYHDGMYCARIDKGTFMPLKRPAFSNDTMVLEPIDNDIKFWAAMKLQELRMRLEDDEYRKKSLYIMFGAILVVCIFVAVVIWMSYSYVNSHTAAQGIIADKLTIVADKMGLGGPG